MPRDLPCWTVSQPEPFRRIRGRVRRVGVSRERLEHVYGFGPDHFDAVLIKRRNHNFVLARLTRACVRYQASPEFELGPHCTTPACTRTRGVVRSSRGS